MGWGNAIGAAIGAGAAIYTGNKAADAQEGAAERAAALQREMFNQIREDQAPYRRVGTNALNRLSRIVLDGQIDNFKGLPGYQFRMNEGIKALDRSAAARGMLQSGRQMKDITRFGQNLASNEFGNYTNRLASLAGIGQTATNATGNAGMSAAGNAGGALQNAGAARASAYENIGSSINSGINNLLFLNQLDNL